MEAKPFGVEGADKEQPAVAYNRQQPEADIREDVFAVPMTNRIDRQEGRMPPYNANESIGIIWLGPVEDKAQVFDAFRQY